MARRKRADPNELPLFDEPLRDFPLRSDDGDPESAVTTPHEPPSPVDASEAVPRVAVVPAAAGEPRTPTEPAGPTLDVEPAAGLVDRLWAAAVDLGVHLLMLAAAALAPWTMGIALTVDDWPPFAGLTLVFSFIYWVMALAFWGQTPGMARARLEARGMDGERLSIGQAIGRWLGALATAALAGLPLLLAVGGRSLSDRLSGSRTVKIQYS